MFGKIGDYKKTFDLVNQVVVMTKKGKSIAVVRPERSNCYNFTKSLGHLNIPNFNQWELQDFSWKGAPTCLNWWASYFPIFVGNHVCMFKHYGNFSCKKLRVKVLTWPIFTLCSVSNFRARNSRQETTSANASKATNIRSTTEPGTLTDKRWKKSIGKWFRGQQQGNIGTTHVPCTMYIL